MNDVILMAIKGGRYLEAENQMNQLILNSPDTETYFLMGTIKSNLLLNKGRDLSEVIFCFEKAQSLSNDKSQTIVDCGAFLFGIYKQLEEIDKELKKQITNKAFKTLAGIALTYFSASILDNARSSFGNITGIVGASLGVGVTIEGLVEIGDITKQSEFVLNLKNKIEDYLKNNFPQTQAQKVIQENFFKVDMAKLRETKNLFPNEFYDFEEASIEDAPKNPKLFMKEYMNEINNGNFLFAMKYNTTNFVLFFEEGIKASWGFLGQSLIEFNYYDISKFESAKNHAKISFSRGTETNLKGAKTELRKDMNLDLIKCKHVKVKGLFSSHDYSNAYEYFNSCFIQ